MPTPSLLIVPARFKSGKLYSQLPTSGAGDFTVTRATAATRVNASGFIESVASGIPRLDYFASGGTVGCPALLVEPSGQNLVQRSEEFNDAYWTKTSTTASGNITTSPDGTLTADKIIENENTDSHYVRRSFALSGTYAISVYAKAAERDRIWVGSISTGRYTIFDLTNGTVVTQVGISDSQITKLKDGWYRCAVIDTINLTAFLSYGIVSGTSRTYSGDGTSGVFLWGAQLEVGSVATSYIPTTTAAVTRNADVITVSGAVSGSIGQTEGTLYAEVDLRNFANAGIFFSISDGTSSNRVQVYKFTDSKIYADRISATQSAITSISTSALTAGVYKLAFAYKTGDSALFINGVQIGSTALQTFTMGTLTKVNVGTRFDNTQFLNDRIRAAALYTTRLTNAELAALTNP